MRQFLKEGDYLLWSSPIHLCVKEDAPSFLHGPERVVDIQEGQEVSSFSLRKILSKFGISLKSLCPLSLHGMCKIIFKKLSFPLSIIYSFCKMVNYADLSSDFLI